jgi:hypothetical protein
MACMLCAFHEALSAADVLAGEEHPAESFLQRRPYGEPIGSQARCQSHRILCFASYQIHHSILMSAYCMGYMRQPATG